MLFFDKKPAAEKSRAQRLWVYDFRTNVHFALEQNPLRRPDPDDFVTPYLSGKDRAERVKSTGACRRRSMDPSGHSSALSSA